MSTIELNVKSRRSGKTSCSKLRKSQLVPAVIYGKGAVNLFISMEEKHAIKLRIAASQNPVIELKSDEKELNGKKVSIKDISLNPVTRLPLHIDFLFC